MMIDGRAIAAGIIAELRLRNRSFFGRKVLGILVGASPASLSFLREKKRVAAALGIEFAIKKIALPVTEEELIAKVAKLTAKDDVIGAIVQLPIPIEGINTQVVLDAVPYKKDIDCLGTQRMGEFSADPAGAVIAPPAIGAVQRVLAHVGIPDIRGKRLAVYGFGRLIGKPVVAWARAQGAEVTVLRRNSTQEEVLAALRSADIVVTGVGVADLINIHVVRQGTIVIDFGYPADINAVAADKKGILVTPTPGGTGPVLVAELFRNLYALQ